MVTSCPKSANSQLSSKCAQEERPLDDYDFLQDVPVKSSVTGFVYRNIFCAECHADDQHLEDVTIDLICEDFPMKNFGILKKMNYNPGSLTWTAALTEDMFVNYFQNFSNYLHLIGDTISCHMLYNTKGRECLNITRKCSESWPDDMTSKRCASHNYMVVAQEVSYKNFYCAICNNVPSEDILCELYTHEICSYIHPSLTNIFKLTGECEETECWNSRSQECEPIISKYDRNLTTSLSNGSLYINSTGKLYIKEEYEMVGEEEVQVHLQQTGFIHCAGGGSLRCKLTPVHIAAIFKSTEKCEEAEPMDREQTVSVLNLVSTVVICISLVCMLLHLFLFLYQPERLSAPTMSHMCMVCFLFLAELLFLLAFRGLKDSYLCLACALLMDFFFTATFLWTSVISFDMCLAFRSRTFRRKGLKTFAIYFGIVAVPSLLKTLTVALVDNLSSQDFFLRPNFGMNRCWYNATWSLSIFFLGPVFAVVTTNLLVYIYLVCDLSRQQKVAKLAGATGSRNQTLREGKKAREARAKGAQIEPPSEPKEKKADSPFKKTELEKQLLINTYRTQLGIYTKVALLMGIGWVLPLIGVFIQSIVLDYFSVILNGLEGTFIFLSFDCNLDRWRNAFRRHKSCLKETETLSTLDEQWNVSGLRYAKRNSVSVRLKN